ncbi:MAG: hypothetical protein P8099_17515 [Gemmatimonadota bacterium]
MLRASLLRSALLALGSALVLGQGASAQSGVLHGRVMGANGPVPDLPVALHRVNPDGSGSMLDQTVTDSTGRFQFQVTMSGDSAVYFAATRMDDNLFVGPAMKSALPAGEYVIDVGPNAEAIPMGAAGGGNAPVAGELASGPEAGGGGGYGYGWLGLLALVVVGAAIGVITWSRRPRLSVAEQQRSRLVRLASLEEEYADRDDLDSAERARYEEQRTGLRDELLGR